MRSRKTVDVSRYAQTLQIALGRATTDPERKAFIFALECLLMDSHNYRGFQYRQDYKNRENIPGWSEYDRVYYLPPS